MDRREEFVRQLSQYEEDGEVIELREYQARKQRESAKGAHVASRANGRRQEPVRYSAKKGTAHNAKKRKRKPNTRLAALILAAAIGVGGVTAINNHEASQQEPANMIEMQQDGVDLQTLGLSAETIELFEKYDEYFENFDEKNQYGLTDDQIIAMIGEIRGMHFSTVKEKMGSLVGENPQNIKMYYGTDHGDGHEWTRITINEDSYNRESYTNDSGIFFKKNDIPEELSDIIWQLEDLDSLESNLRTDKITKINAVKELEKLYEELEQVATGDFIKDEKGNISIIHYEDKQTEQAKEEEERD